MMMCVCGIGSSVWGGSGVYVVVVVVVVCGNVYVI